MDSFHKNSNNNKNYQTKYFIYLANKNLSQYMAFNRIVFLKWMKEIFLLYFENQFYPVI